jgi:glutaredoxin
MKLLVFFLIGACGQGAQERSKPEVAPRPEAPRVHADRKDLMFRYLDASKGAFETAMAISDVPEAAREKVVVYDPALDSPGWFFLADLRKANSDGTYPCSVIHASQMKLMRTSSGNGATAESSSRVVRLFSATWCGVCKTARRFLKKQGIRFIEKDIEKDSGAAQELQAFAKRKGVPKERLSGVPIFIIGQEMLFGFDGPTILKKLSKAAL